VPNRRVLKGAMMLLAVVMSPPPATASDMRLQPGSYHVEVRLELPHLSAADATKDVSICIDESAGPAAALRVLSTNNPLADCPVHGRTITGGTVRFEVACDGPNAAKGSAVFELTQDSYRGRIAMKMGGKNMTMTEHQTGRRLGPCKPRD
jgi:Protein of unknown function (DUF3617)